MADTATSKIKPGTIILGLVVTAVTVFVIVWAAGEGWKSGSK